LRSGLEHLVIRMLMVQRPRHVEVGGTGSFVGPAALSCRLRRLTCRQTAFARSACW
jgi:hypothetical protein